MDSSKYFSISICSNIKVYFERVLSSFSLFGVTQLLICVEDRVKLPLKVLIKIVQPRNFSLSNVEIFSIFQPARPYYNLLVLQFFVIFHPACLIQPARVIGTLEQSEFEALSLKTNTEKISFASLHTGMFKNYEDFWTFLTPPWWTILLIKLVF